MFRLPQEDQFTFTSHCEDCVRAVLNGDRFCVFHWGYVGGFTAGYTEGWAEAIGDR